MYIAIGYASSDINLVYTVVGYTRPIWQLAYKARSWAWFREFVHTLGRVVAKPTHQRVCCRYQAKHSKGTEEIRLLSEATMYIFPHRNGCEKHEKRFILFYISSWTVIHVRIRVFSRDFRAFCRFLNLSSAYSVTGETVKTTTGQRNYRNRQRTYFLIEIGEKDMKVSLFYLIHPTNSNSHENSGILTGFPCFMSNF